MKIEIRNPRVSCKTPAVCTFQGAFPLTPALSLRERENQRPRCDNSKWLGFSNALPIILPLPEGEGRGEGERSVRIPERCDFCNRLPNDELRNKNRRAVRTVCVVRWSACPFGFRASEFLRISSFGFRISTLTSG